MVGLFFAVLRALRSIGVKTCRFCCCILQFPPRFFSLYSKPKINQIKPFQQLLKGGGDGGESGDEIAAGLRRPRQAEGLPPRTSPRLARFHQKTNGRGEGSARRGGQSEAPAPPFFNFIFKFNFNFRRGGADPDEARRRRRGLYFDIRGRRA